MIFTIAQLLQSFRGYFFETPCMCNTPPPFQGQHFHRWLYASI